jgi:transcriptional regulator
MVLPLDSQEENRHDGFILVTKGTDLIQGTLDMLILKSLSLQPMHGFGVTQRIEQISEGVFKVNPGSLLLAFQRLERAGLVEGEWRASDNNRRARYYRLTRTGRRRLTMDTDDWKRRVDAIARLLEA